MKSIYRPDRRRGQRVRRRERSMSFTRSVLRAAVVPGLILLTLLAAASAAVTWGLPWARSRVKTSTLFALKEVRVLGNRNLTEERILEAAGLVFGENILATDLEAVRSRLAAHPLLRDATVRRLLPSEIVVEVEERVPAVAVRGQSRYIVDAEGFVMTVAREDMPIALPCLTGLAVRGGRVAEDDLQDLRDGLEIARIIAASDFPPPGTVGCIDLGDGSDAVLLPAGRSPRVHLGREAVAERLRRWKAVAPDIAAQWQEVEYIDLRAEGLVVTKPLPPPSGDDEPGKG